MNNSSVCSVSVAERNECDSSTNDADCNSRSSFSLTNLPPEVLQLILKNFSYDNIAKLRLVCKYFNRMCSSLLNSEFFRLRTAIQQRFNGIKAQMPRRESARRKHPLARESDIMETLHMRLSLLHMTFGKHIEKKFCCFFPGEIIDEIHRILRYTENTPSLNRAYKVTDELFDLSTMAMEFFKEHIEPVLPEISYFTPELFEPPLLAATKACLTVEDTAIASSSSKNIPISVRDPVLCLYKRLKKLRELVKRNVHDIGNVKHSLKLAKRKVSSLEKEVQQIKWQQNDSGKVIIPDFCNINEILSDLSRRKLELELVTSKIPATKHPCTKSASSTIGETSGIKSNECPPYFNKLLPATKEKQSDYEVLKKKSSEQSLFAIPFIKEHKNNISEKNDKGKIPSVSFSKFPSGKQLMTIRNTCVDRNDLPVKKQKLQFFPEFNPSTSFGDSGNYISGTKTNDFNPSNNAISFTRKHIENIDASNSNEIDTEKFC